MQGWVLALMSSAHVAVAVVRQHRSRPGPRRIAFVTLSYAFAALPWLRSDAIALGAGLVAHAAWLAVTDRLARGTDSISGPKPSPERPAAASKPARSAAASAGPVSGFTALPVLAVVDETPDIRTFRLARPDGWTFSAGQFLPVRVRVDGHEHVRCYSISSAPGASAFLEISVKRQGMVSNALHATAQPGGALSARPPAGRFVYPADDDRPVVLLGAGVGITPLMSMVRHGVLTDPHRPITLIQSARHPNGLAFADELRVLERRYPRFRWVPAVSSGEGGPESYPGRIDETLLRTAAPALAHSVVGICGPESMIAAMRDTLDVLGVPRDQVRYELFEAVTAATGAGQADVAAPGGGEGTVVTFLHSDVLQPARQGQTLLQAAEAGGVNIPTICRSGVCGTCRTRVVRGDVHCPSDALDADDTAAGFVLACVSAIRTDCSVEA